MVRDGVWNKARRVTLRRDRLRSAERTVDCRERGQVCSPVLWQVRASQSQQLGTASLEPCADMINTILAAKKWLVRRKPQGGWCRYECWVRAVADLESWGKQGTRRGQASCKFHQGRVERMGGEGGEASCIERTRRQQQNTSRETLV